MKQLLLAVFLPVFTFAATNSIAATTTTCDSNNLDGVVAGSYPCFETSVKLKLKLAHDKVYTDELSASYYEDYRGPHLFGGGISNFYVDANYKYPISDTIFNFSASLKDGEIQSGSMSIWGSINGSEQQKLMWADLTGDYAQVGNLIGFNTTNIQCGTAITALVSCTMSEVVYFALESNGSKTFDFTKNQNFKGTAFTSVPIPAAVWLFGSGLLGLAGIARKRKTG